MEITASVIVPTWHRANALSATLDALTAQDTDGFEIIVVCDGDDPAIRKLSETRQDAVSVRWIFHDRNRGLPAARNTGARAASGSLIVFLDDDVIPAVDWLRRHRDTHLQEPLRTIVLGSLTEEYQSPPADSVEEMLRLRRAEGYARFFARCAANGGTFEFAPHCGNNSSLTRDTFEEIGGFDEDQRTIHEDLEMGERARAIGIRFVLEPNARAVHVNDRSAASYDAERPALAALSDVRRIREKRQLTRGTSAIHSLHRGSLRGRIKQRLAWRFPRVFGGIGRELVAFGADNGSARITDTGRTLLQSAMYWGALRKAGETEASLAALAGHPVSALVMHAVSGSPVGEERRHHSSESHFAASMRRLAGSGYTTLDPATYLKGSYGPKSVFLTFDDGYEDFYSHAFPILRELGLVATVFLVPQYIGGVNEWDSARGFRARRMLSREQILEMRDHGVLFGSHSMSHARLTDLPDRELVAEVRDSRSALEDMLGRAITTFAYPGGHVDERVRDAVASAGYTTAFTAAEGRNDWHDPLLLRRASFAEIDLLIDLRLILSTGRGLRSNTRHAVLRSAKFAADCLPGSIGNRLAMSARAADARFRARMWERRSRDLAEVASKAGRADQ